MVSQGFFSGSADRKKRMAGSSDTKVALGGDNLGSMGGIGAIIGVGGLGIKGIQSAVEGGRRLKENIQRRLNPEEDNKQSFFSPRLNEVKVAQTETTSDQDDFQSYIKAAGIRYPKQLSPTFMRMLKENYRDDKRDGFFKDGQFINKKPEQNIFSKTGNFLANLVTPPAVAGTLEGKPTRFAGEADPTPRPKLDYVNPDKTTMTGSEIRDAFKPSNLLGYKDKFGRYGEAVDRDRQQTINRVSERYSSMPAPDARSLNQVRADQESAMRDKARLRNEAFKRGETKQIKSADVTYGTNMLSNPAFGFRGKMKPEDQKKYDKSARDATEAAKPDPSVGNVIAQTVNRVSGLVGGPQMSLESIGERQLRLANKEVNRPSYQKEAYARNQLGITIGDIRERNMNIIRQNAAARNEAFQSYKRAAAVDRAARRYGSNTGSGRTGGFGTVGKGMPSNPGSQRQTGVGVSANNLSRHKAGSSTSRGGVSRSTSRGQGGRSSSRSRGGTGTGRSSQGSKSSARGASGSAGSRGRGGTGPGRTSTSRTASKASRSRTGRSRSQCDIRTKIDINPLTNNNLIRDDLANVAYFVLEIK